MPVMDEHNPQARLEMNQKKRPRARGILHMQAPFWRTLMGLGMPFRKLAPPRPPKPNFQWLIFTTSEPGMIMLHFYLPKHNNTHMRLWHDRLRYQDRIGVFYQKEAEREAEGEAIGGLGSIGRRASRRISATFDELSRQVRGRSQSAREWGEYPVVINFHGGGFTLGTATDDARWCGTVADECNAVVISVDYRLAPLSPFPAAVYDGVAAVQWVNENARELGIDPEKIALSGFSSGGNMAFTIPLSLYDPQADLQCEDAKTSAAISRKRLVQHGAPSTFDSHGAPLTADSVSSSSTMVPSEAGHIELVDPAKPAPPLARMQTKGHICVCKQGWHRIPDVKIRCIVSWYPSLDYTRTREQQHATCLRKDQALPASFTDSFDESYLHPPQNVALDSPYLSPGVAPTDLLKHGLPEEIILLTCEWDILLDEGEAFRQRLVSEPLNKKVWYKLIEGVPHGWDKAPNHLKPTPGVREHYLQACKELRRIFGPQSGVAMEDTTRWGPSAAPSGSISVVR